MVPTSDNLDGVMVSRVVQNGRDVASIPAVGTLFPIFITPMTLVAINRIMSKLCGVWYGC